MFRFYAWLLRFCLLLVLPGVARAQAPAWTGVTPGSLTQASGSSLVEAAAVDASGNVVVVGYFYGTVSFGSTQLVSASGSQDFFVGKWLPATSTWAWVQGGGGIGTDIAYSLALSGNNIYVAGSMSNNTTNGYQVSFGPGNVQYGIAVGSTVPVGGSIDMVLVKYVDNGTSASVAWSQAAGGIANEEARGVAVSGSNVYLVGNINNNRTNYNSVVFGGSGATPGTVAQYGATATGSADVVVAKYTDNGSSATFGWSQVGGGTGADAARAIAVSGNSLYVVGTLTNTLANAQGVLFGGSGAAAGTVRVNGASTSSSTDQLLLKYTDNGPTGTLVWNQVGGGTGPDAAASVAVSGSSVYVTGAFTNNRVNANAVLLGGSGTTAGTVPQYGASSASTTGTLPPADLLLAKYTDNGTSASVVWSQAAGGTENDTGADVAVSGSSVYVTGYTYNNQANANSVVFGGSRTTAGTATQLGVNATASADLLVARYTDNGSSATFNWSQVGGGTTADVGLGLAVSGSTVYVAGYIAANRSAAFGTATGSPVVGTSTPRGVLVQLSSTVTAGTWQAVVPTTTGGNSYIRGSATDAAGNLFVAGYFTGQVAFGNTVLSTGSDADAFVAKYVPATNTWAWAQSAGGTGFDQAYGVAVSGNSVYITGSIINTATNAYNVQFGGTGPGTHTAVQYGITPPANTIFTSDLFVAKYMDNGSSASFGWSQVAGGDNTDYGQGIAASGNNVYVAGYLTNTLANANAGVLGGSGATPGTQPLYGASNGLYPQGDVVLLKYVDNGPSASVSWSQVGGGTGEDQATAVAVSGSSVYLTGAIVNNTADVSAVRFGGSGATGTPGSAVQYGSSASNYVNVLVAKYTDNGLSATLNWTQAAGGVYHSIGRAIAVAGNRVYVTGGLYGGGTGFSALFGASGTAPGTLRQASATSANSEDLFVAKYLDGGNSASVAWAQVGGGTGDDDEGNAIAVQGNNVFVAGTLNNSSANANGVLFGGSGLTPGTAAQAGIAPYASLDAVVAKYVDNGSGATLAWTQIAGSDGRDNATSLLATGTNLYVMGYAQVPANFGSFTLGTPAAGTVGFVGRFGATALPVRAAGGSSLLSLYPNPARGKALLTGASPGAPVRVFDMLGREVAAASANAAGTTALLLPTTLPAGVYVVRAGLQSARLTIE